jgi:hypothetical protein
MAREGMLRDSKDRKKKSPKSWAEGGGCPGRQGANQGAAPRASRFGLA